MNNKKMKQLISLKKNNEEVKERKLRVSRRLNGIACPNCGEELYDTYPERLTGGETFLSFIGFGKPKPLEVKIYCSTCRWTGTRLS